MIARLDIISSISISKKMNINLFRAKRIIPVTVLILVMGLALQGIYYFLPNISGHKKNKVGNALCNPLDTSNLKVFNEFTWPTEFYPTFGDFNFDGIFEFAGLIQTKSGDFKYSPARDMGGFIHGRKIPYLVDLNNDGQNELLITEKNGIYNSYVYLYEYESQKERFTLNRSFFDKRLQCHSEQVLFFDYNNDSLTDILITCYTHKPNTSFYFMKNLGGLKFENIKSVSRHMNFIEKKFRVEGAQVADINRDGYLDFYAASKLMLNAADGTFNSASKTYGIRRVFDEGVLINDIDLNGSLELLRYIPKKGVFSANLAPNSNPEDFSSLKLGGHKPYTGLLYGDFNKDGKVDFVLGSDNGSVTFSMHLSKENSSDYECFVSKPIFESHEKKVIVVPTSTGDVDGDGSLDFSLRVLQYSKAIIEDWEVVNVLFKTKIQSAGSTYRVRVVDQDGNMNLFGRQLDFFDKLSGERVASRIIDGGSGYLSLNAYDLLIHTPRPVDLIMKYLEQTFELEENRRNVITLKNLVPIQQSQSN